MPFIEWNIGGIRRFEIGRDMGTIALVQDGLQQRRAIAFPLVWLPSGRPMQLFSLHLNLR